MTTNTVKKTFTIPAFLVEELDSTADLLVRSQSSLVADALAMYLHRFRGNGKSLQGWMMWEASCYRSRKRVTPEPKVQHKDSEADPDSDAAYFAALVLDEDSAEDDEYFNSLLDK